MKQDNLNRREFIKLSGSAALSMAALSGKAHSQANTDTPNLLFIFTDQHRREAMGFWSKPQYEGALNTVSDPVVTPALDGMADESVVFTRATSTCPVCSPMRAMLMSGMFPEQNGIRINCFAGREEELKQDAECLTDVLYGSGYNTAYFGKVHWHKTEPLFDTAGNYVGTTTAPGGNYVNNYDTYVPPGDSRHDVEYWYQALKDVHKDPRCYSNDPDAIEGKADGILHRPHLYSPLNEANHIIEYLNNSRGQRDPDKPFCLMWSLNPPHSPYGSVNDCDEDAYNQYYRDMTIDELQNRPNVTTSTGSGNVRYYFANVTGVDRQIGRVLETLDGLGLKDNTIVVFTADHGEMMGSHDRMAKNVEYEEAFSVPFLIRYPGRLGHHLEDMLLSTTDIMPTLLGLMGLRDLIPGTVEGSDYSHILQNPDAQIPVRPKSAPFFQLAAPFKGVKTDTYTFTLNNDGSVRSLFNNIDDPYQMNDLDFSSIPEEDQIMLRQELGYWLVKANDTWFQDNKFADFIIYPDTAVKNKGGRPDSGMFLFQSRPNPFKTETSVKLRILEPGHVSLEVRNAFGRLVRSLHRGGLRAGDHDFTWDGRDASGRNTVPGMYIIVAKSDDGLIQKKIQKV